MPKTGTSDVDQRPSRSRSRRSARAGSPGPLLRNTPSGFVASSSDAGVVAGIDAHVAAVRAQAGAGCSTSCRSRTRRSSAAASARRSRRDAELVRVLDRRPVERALRTSRRAPGRSLPSSAARARARRAPRGSSVAGRDHAAHHAGRAQHARQRARVDVGDRDDVVARPDSRAACRPRASCSRPAIRRG